MSDSCREEWESDGSKLFLVILEIISVKMFFSISLRSSSYNKIGWFKKILVKRSINGEECSCISDSEKLVLEFYFLIFFKDLRFTWVSFRRGLNQASFKITVNYKAVIDFEITWILFEASFFSMGFRIPLERSSL